MMNTTSSMGVGQSHYSLLGYGLFYVVSPRLLPDCYLSTEKGLFSGLAGPPALLAIKPTPDTTSFQRLLTTHFCATDGGALNIYAHRLNRSEERRVGKKCRCGSY